MKTVWKLYDEARKEVEANMEHAVMEAYAAKLEARIEELENQVEQLTEDLNTARGWNDRLPF